MQSQHNNQTFQQTLKRSLPHSLRPSNTTSILIMEVDGTGSDTSLALTELLAEKENTIKSLEMQNKILNDTIKSNEREVALSAEIKKELFKVQENIHKKNIDPLKNTQFEYRNPNKYAVILILNINNFIIE